MQARIDEIAPDIYRLSVHTTKIGGADGFTFNHFLLKAEQPLLFHGGMRSLFPALVEAAAKVLPLGSLRWISHGASFQGNGKKEVQQLADYYEQELRSAIPASAGKH